MGLEHSNNMLDLYLIRHPQTAANLEKKVQGALLDEAPQPGYEPKVEELADKLDKIGPIDAVLTSILQRARIPAQLLFELLMKKDNKPDYIATNLLNERNWGEYNGRPYSEVPFGYEGLHQYLFALTKINSGEGHEDVLRRLTEFDRLYIEPLVQGGRKGHVRLVALGHQFLLTHMLKFYMERNPAAGKYEDWPNLFVKHLQFEAYTTNKKAIETPF